MRRENSTLIVALIILSACPSMFDSWRTSAIKCNSSRLLRRVEELRITRAFIMILVMGCFLLATWREVRG